MTGSLSFLKEKKYTNSLTSSSYGADADTVSTNDARCLLSQNESKRNEKIELRMGKNIQRKHGAISPFCKKMKMKKKA